MWEAGFDLIHATDPILEDNVVAGTERGAYHVDGQACGTVANKWKNNQAHSGRWLGVISGRTIKLTLVGDLV